MNVKTAFVVGLLLVSAASPALPQSSEQEAQPVLPPETSASPASAASPPPENPEPTLENGGELTLMCLGGGSANKLTVSNSSGIATAYGSNGSSAHGSGNSTTYGSRSEGFEDQVNLSMTLTDGRLRMPRSMLPLFHGGDDGWFKLRGIEVSEQEITATVAVALVNRPKLRLDRYTGVISIAGKAGNFSGRCVRFDPSEAERQF